MSQWRFKVFDVLDSTSSYCSRALEAGEVERLAVLARTQTHARGTKGRAWVGSEKNLAFSFICSSSTQTFSAEFMPAMPYLAAVATLRGIEQCISSEKALEQSKQFLSLKWPNDILLRGEKMGGILIESFFTPKQQSMVVGIGLNLGCAPKVPGRRVSCLTDVLGVSISPEDVAYAILEQWDQLYALLNSEGMKSIFTKWLERGTPIGTRLEVTNREGCFSGIFKGFNETGALILEDSEGKISHIYAGEIG